MAKVLLKGNEAVVRAAIEAGCKYFFGYPITPQNEIPEYFSKELPKIGGAFVQGESEVASINMLYGAAAAGARAMTSSSSPGIALMQEGIGYICKAEVPAVIVNMMRGGPGLGGIQPSQADYKMCVKGGSNGDYHNVVLAPGNVQELVDMVQEAFDIADQYRILVIVLADGLIGQMMEPVELRKPAPRPLPEKDWALTGRNGGQTHRVYNLKLQAPELEQDNFDLFKKYALIEENEKRHEDYRMEDAEYAFASYGTASRVVRTAVDRLREEGYKIGLVRPQTLWPFPDDAFNRPQIKKFLDVELNMGQMIDDLALACGGRDKVEFFGHTGGVLITVDEVVDFAKKIMGGAK
ncbi:MAG: 3-methyl-2-oxobutanoate dehydrogenase subunit VorB [Lachnospiraceae bacterium]